MRSRTGPSDSMSSSCSNSSPESCWSRSQELNSSTLGGDLHASVGVLQLERRAVGRTFDDQQVDRGVTTRSVAGDGVLRLLEVELDRSLVEQRLGIVDEQRRVPLQGGCLTRVEGGDHGGEIELLEAVEHLVERVLRLFATRRLDPVLGDVGRLVGAQPGLFGGGVEHAEVPPTVDLDGRERDVELGARAVVELGEVDVVAADVEQQFADRQRLAVDLGVDLARQLRGS